MDTDLLEKLNRLDREKLMDIIYYYRQYNYDEEVKEYAIQLLINKYRYTLEELENFGLLNNTEYELAEKVRRRYRVYCFIAYFLVIPFIPLAFLFSYFAFREKSKFYRYMHISQKSDSENFQLLTLIEPVFLLYESTKMKDILKGLK